MSKIETLPLGYENRIQIEEHSMYVEDGILFVITVGDSDLETAIKMRDAALEIRNAMGALNTLADINKAGKSTPEARKVWKELSEFDGFKIALVGLHPVARVIANFSMMVSGNKNFRFYTNHEEALNWLKGNE